MSGPRLTAGARGERTAPVNAGKQVDGTRVTAGSTDGCVSGEQNGNESAAVEWGAINMC